MCTIIVNVIALGKAEQAIFAVISYILGNTDWIKMLFELSVRKYILTFALLPLACNEIVNMCVFRNTYFSNNFFVYFSCKLQSAKVLLQKSQATIFFKA